MWWLKADRVDVVSGICESVSSEWSGDVDLNDRDTENKSSTFELPGVC